MVEYGHLKKALKNLEEQYENYKTMDDALPAITREAVVESAVHRMEICCQCLLNALEKHLREEGMPVKGRGTRAILIAANENELLPTSIEDWREYMEARNATSHEYGETYPQTTLDMMERFIDDVIDLYQIMTGEIWGQ